MPALAWLVACLGSHGGWAVGAGGSVSGVLEARLGEEEGYSTHHLGEWVGSEEFVSGTTSGQPAANPDVWTGGSLVRNDVAGFCYGGAGVFAATSEAACFRRSWGHLDLRPPGAELGSVCCRLSFSFPEPVQSVQWAELWGAILSC